MKANFWLSWAVLFLALPWGGQAAWVPVGPFGGDVRSLAADPRNPDRMFLGTPAGQVFVSTNGGERWDRLAGFSAPSNWVVDDLLLDPRDPQTLYAGLWSLADGQEGGVFKSTDGGSTWRALEGIRGQSVRVLALAPSDPNVLVAGTLSGVFRSRDAGERWQRISPEGHPEIRNLKSIAMDPRDPEVIYAGTWHLPWKSSDGGAHWTSIKTGLLDDSDIFSIVVDPSHPAVLYIGACSGIYRSENGGEAWQKIQGIPNSSRRTQTLVLDPKNPNVLYAGTTAGLWRTRNSGQAWERLTSHTWIINAIVLDARDSDHFFLGMDRAGVMESRDGGGNFSGANYGFAQRQVSRIVADARDSGRFYAGLLHDGEFGGVYTTENNGLHWRQMSAGLEGRDVLSLLVVAEPDWKLLAGTPDGVFELTRQEPSWRNRSQWPTPQGGRNPAAIAARDLYQRRSGEPIYAATSVGLLASPDGRIWKKLPWPAYLREAYAVAAFGEGGRSLLVAASQGLLLSRDAGENWEAVRLNGDRSITVHRIATHPSHPDVVFVGSDAGLFRSTDSAVRWEKFGRGIPFSPITEVLLSPANPLFLMVAGVAGLFQSSNGGDQFARIPGGESPEQLVIQSLALHPESNSPILAASQNNGIFWNESPALLLANRNAPQ